MDLSWGQGHIAHEYLYKSIKKFGEKLEIKDSKVAIGRFIKTENNNQIYTHIFGESCQNGIEYLGFQFDGKKVQLKNSTLSNAWRKMKKRSHGWAKSWTKRYRNKGDDWLLENANLEDRVTEVLRTLTSKQSKLGKDGSIKDWTFISYVKRSEKAFKEYETAFDVQTKKYRKQAISIFEEALDEAIKRHGSEAFKEKGGQL